MNDLKGGEVLGSKWQLGTLWYVLPGTRGENEDRFGRFLVTEINGLEYVVFRAVDENNSPAPGLPEILCQPSHVLRFEPVISSV